MRTIPTFARSAAVVLGLTAIAFAGDPKKAPAPAPTPKPAPEAKPAGGGKTPVAQQQQQPDPTKPAQPGTQPAQPGTQPAQPGSPDPMKAMPEPQPPAEELKKAAKSMSGKWKCTGTATNPDGTEMKAEGTLTIKSDLDGYWMVGTYEQKKTKTMPAMKMVDYRTFDTADKVWKSWGFDNMGGISQSATTRSDPTTMSWAGTYTLGGQTFWARTTETMADKNQMAYSAEQSFDGKTFTPAWSGTCKKS
jgi:hypothetical protein